MKVLKYVLLFLLPIHLSAQNFFVEPRMTFIQKPTEVLSDMTFNGSTSVAAMQTAIDAKRVSFPNNIIRITLSGIFTVTTVPLQISDRMILLLNDATIIAASNATATSLISVVNGHYISITALGTSTLNGNNLNLTGITITNSGKTHIDKLNIQNCNSGGVSYTGAGAVVYADAGSVTRCSITNCSAFGIYTINSFNFICTDNAVQSCGIGISVNSDYAGIANNSLIGCTTGLYVAGQYDAVAYNTVDNCTTGISVNHATSEALISHNTLKNNATGLNLACGVARIYYNTFQNNTNAFSGSGANTTHVFCNSGVGLTDVSSKGCVYFNPPLIGNQHTDLIKSGKTRVDITLTSGSISSIRKALDNAHVANPTAVVVAHLNGDFVTTGTTDSLLVKENECILLTGSISNGSGNAPSVLYFKDSNIISSFSGGTIDGENLNGSTALVYITGSANVVLDNVNVLNSAGQGITKRDSYSPTYLRGCFVDNSTSRNIWQLASKRLIAFSNTSTNSVYDGLDFDAYTSNSVAINNTLNSNKRNGVFIEEGAKNHIVMSNTANYNVSPGIAFYNMAVANLHSSQNLIANNVCNFNNRGVQLNALSTDRSTSDNVIFNNTCNNNTDVGVGGIYNATNVQNNYIALNSIQNNTNGPFYATRDYVSNTDWNLNGITPIEVSTAKTSSSLALTAYNVVTVLNGGTLTINGSTMINTLRIERGGKVTNSSSLTAARFTINSDASGTGTFTDTNVNGGLTVTGMATVNQSLQHAGGLRTWYMTPPVASAAPSGMSSIKGFDEPTFTWSAHTPTMQAKTGYMVNPAAAANDISFTGTLNTGDQNVALTSRTGIANKAGFNLIGNPYPSFLDWKQVYDYTANAGSTYPNRLVMRSSTLWYRTKSGTYSFCTVNGSSGIGSPATASRNIPPMQAFWVRAVAGGGTLTLKNSMRLHESTTNVLKAPSTRSIGDPLLRLQVSNGINTDEAVLHFSENATNGLDDYDSPKMSNDNSAIPEILTTVEGEKMVINSLNSIPMDQPIGLGFVPGNATSFTIKANEVTNIPSVIKLILRDNVTLAETDLTDGVAVYAFGPAETSADRFSILFRSPGVATNLEKASKEYLMVYSNTSKQLTISIDETLQNGLLVSVYNSIGQKLLTTPAVGTNTLIQQPFKAGVYFVILQCADHQWTKKVKIN